MPARRAHMDVRIELTREEAICRQRGVPAFAAPLKQFIEAIVPRGDSLELTEAIPDGVRFLRSRGPVTVVVIEDLPQVRTVRWLADESPEPFGRGAIYRTARLAFPFVIVVVAFRRGGLTGFQQCFYRTERLRTLGDELLLPNLYNVSTAYRQQCWLCLANINRDLTPLSWNEKVLEVRRHMWAAGFNKSSWIHERSDFCQAMRGLDRRIQSLDAWEEATRADPFFALQVKWRAAGCTIGGLMDQMLEGAGSPRPQHSFNDLVRVLGGLAAMPGAAAASAGR